jgi:hypothetical protein
MTSAVVEARRVLKRGGLLLDIHPTDERTSLEVWHARYGELAEAPENLERVVRVPVGWLEHDKSLADFAAATDALAEALESGFVLHRSRTFDYQYFFDSLDELNEYLEDNQEHARPSEELLERALLEMQKAATRPKVVMVQRTVVTALRRT